jgi:uncharacterized protein YacL
MSHKSNKNFLPHYFAMSVFIISAYFAFKLSGTVAGVLSVIAVLAANPMFLFPAEKIRWIILLVSTILIIVFYPDLRLLKAA